MLTLLVLIALYALHRLPITGDHYFSLNLKWVGDLALLTEITDQLLGEKVQIKSRSVVRQPKTGSCRVTLVLRMRNEELDARIVDRLQSDERFDEVGWH